MSKQAKEAERHQMVMRPCIRCKWAQPNGYSEEHELYKWMCRHPEAEIHDDEHIDPVKGTAWGLIPTCDETRRNGPCQLAGWLFEEMEKPPRATAIRGHGCCPSYPEK